MIDTNVIGKWPSVRDAKISNNGQYVCYTIYNRPQGSQTLVIQAVNGKWKKELPGLQSATFSYDSTYLKGTPAHI